MAYDSRKLVAYGAAGLLIATFIILGVQLIPVPFIPIGKTGVLVIKLTDAPVELENLYVNISGIEAIRILDDDAEELVPLSFVEEKLWVYVDILTLEDVTMDLSITEIEPGNYAKIRMFITSANATFKDNDGEIPLIVPPGKIDVIVHFEIEDGETTELLIDMQADWVAISRSHRLRPVLKATVL